ncbi:endonuclease I family protein [Halobacillus sp. BBL2006]|uniref:endonuclease I family protein n=1 Tax=Halobacillus sp. BBL2006 TaxID=1543706 RepID=UPI000541B8DF|nr:endonuclease [Halobacillus sp. BBL2006]KHE73055.1 endonuclease I [Halobacillus sp. BBL2006]
MDMRMMEKLISGPSDEHGLKNILDQVKNNKAKIIEDDRIYFDHKKNEKMKETYYKKIDFNSPNIEEIKELVQSTHKNQLRYDPSEYVYPWVDLRPDGKLSSIYSGKNREPEDVIQEDYETSKNRKAAIESKEDRDSSKLISEVVAAFKYNCEHTVPQSWFDEHEPMRGDLHHLFTCEPRCNSIRGNYPYHDFKDYPERTEVEINRVEKQCGKAEDGLFEPEYAKGTVARAMLYFLIRYPDRIGSNHKDKIDEQLLLEWHRNEPPEVYEFHRNQAIYEVQGNRNPFIDFPVEMIMIYKSE